VPTDDDLLAVVRGGIPGTAMPAFAQLTDAERRAVVGHVHG
jgi:mono/diheme cytochrome c family protein